MCMCVCAFAIVAHLVDIVGIETSLLLRRRPTLFFRVFFYLIGVPLERERPVKGNVKVAVLHTSMKLHVF